MGNRAVITFAPYKPTNTAIYLHWNGGRASVQGFLNACKELGYRSPASDPEYGMARLTAAACAFFPGGLSVGIGQAEYLDSSDNGIYVIGKDWDIAERRQHDGEEETDNDKTREITAAVIAAINAAADQVKGN